MKHMLALAALFIVATSAQAALMFDRGDVRLGTGERTSVRATITTWGGTGGYVEFTSCDPSIAVIRGVVEFPPNSHGGHGDIEIIGVTPGQTSICMNGYGVVPVTVVGPPKPAKRRAIRRR